MMHIYQINDIQIQLLLKLNSNLTRFFWLSFLIQIQLLLKLNVTPASVCGTLVDIQIQLLLKLNEAKNLIPFWSDIFKYNSC